MVPERRGDCSDDSMEQESVSVCTVIAFNRVLQSIIGLVGASPTGKKEIFMSFKIVRNDITKMNTQAIVNTASTWVSVGSGCDSAVYKAAGYDELL